MKITKLKCEKTKIQEENDTDTNAKIRYDLVNR